MRRTMTARQRLAVFANVSRVQSDQETYDMAVNRDVELKRQRVRAERVEAERDALRAENERLRTALTSVRKAAGSAQSFTNRLQFIYARAGCALSGEEWDDEWKAQYGYTVRDATMRENERLRALLVEVMDEEWVGPDTSLGRRIAVALDAARKEGEG